MTKLFWLFLALALPHAANACAMEVVATNDSKALKLMELAERQRTTLREHFPFFFGDLTRHRGFPLQLRELRALEIEQWKHDYDEDIKCLIFSSHQKPETIMTDTFGKWAHASASYLEEAFTVYLLQYYLARAMAVYRIEMKKHEQEKTNLSRYYREKVFKQALVRVAFYSRPGQSDIEAFGTEVPIRRLSLQEAFKIRTSVPKEVREFITAFERSVSQAGIQLGREYSYYLSLVQKLWVDRPN